MTEAAGQPTLAGIRARFTTRDGGTSSRRRGVGRRASTLALLYSAGRRVSSLALLCCALLLVSCDRGPEPFVASFPVMGTLASLEIHDRDFPETTREAALTAVRAVYDSVNTVMNTWSPESEISRLNRVPADSTFTLSPWLSGCLARAEEAGRLSGGAFEPTAEPLMRLWGFYRRQGHLPEQGELAAALASLGCYEHDPGTRDLRKEMDETSFDLGGIAKGFAVDRAWEALRELSCENVLIDLGGNLFCAGGARGKADWRVGIRDPLNREQLFAGVSLSGRAVATSGSYERFVTIDGRRYGHIMNPVSGQPSEGLLGVTVIAPEAQLADALSTALFVLGPEAALALLREEHLPGVEAVLVLPPAIEGGWARVLASRTLEDNLALLPGYEASYALEFF